MITKKLPHLLAIVFTVVISLTCYLPLEARDAYDDSSISVDFFYDNLEEDGSWFETEDYGYIWQPSTAREDQDWRPYTHGHWSHTNRGWAWVSDEPFGWATYHYGRWVNIEDTGWCWVPGTTWAPAWVSWRSNDRYIGWAPLPPEARFQRTSGFRGAIDIQFNLGPSHYNFISIEDAGEPSYVGRIVPRDRNITIVNQTTNITNIRYENTVINNYGPDYEVVNRRSQRRLENYRIQDDRDAARIGSYRTVQKPQEGVLSVFAPDLTTVTKGERKGKPSKIERNLAKVTPNTGWKGIKPEEVKSTRAAMEQEKPLEQSSPAAGKEIPNEPKKEKLIERSLNEPTQPGQTPSVIDPANNEAQATPVPPKNSKKGNKNKKSNKQPDENQVAIPEEPKGTPPPKNQDVNKDLNSSSEQNVPNKRNKRERTPDVIVPQPEIDPTVPEQARPNRKKEINRAEKKRESPSKPPEITEQPRVIVEEKRPDRKVREKNPADQVAPLPQETAPVPKTPKKKKNKEAQEEINPEEKPE